MKKELLVLRAWLSMLRKTRQIRRDINVRFLSETKLSISRFDALSALERAGKDGIRAKDLSAELFVTEGNISQLVSALIDDGLVIRRSDKKDARVAIYSLSGKGKKLFSKAAAQHKKWMNEIFKTLSKSEIETLIGVLNKLL